MYIHIAFQNKSWIQQYGKTGIPESQKPEKKIKTKTQWQRAYK